MLIHILMDLTYYTTILLVAIKVQELYFKYFGAV
jgi:hypothetical protein